MSNDRLVKVLDSISTALFSLRDEVRAARSESASFHRQVLAALTAEDPQWPTVPPGPCESTWPQIGFNSTGKGRRFEICALRSGHAGGHESASGSRWPEGWANEPEAPMPCASKVNLGAAAKYATCTLRHGHDGLHEEDDVTWTDMVDGKGALYLDVIIPEFGTKRWRE